MKFVWALLITAAVCSSKASAARIIGGEAIVIEQYPSAVQVDFFNKDIWSQSCAGSILTTSYVLSAAHCYDGNLFDINTRRIRAGATNRNTGGVIVSLLRRVNHPSYGSLGMDADISLLQLSTPLTYSSTIQNVVIPVQGFELPNNLPVVFAGWGSTSEGGPASSELQKVDVFTIDANICNNSYGNLWPIAQQITNNMICAGIMGVGGKDVCAGDSGGPLFYENFLVGVVSFGYGCARDDYPGVSTKVSAFTDWIVQNAS